MSTFTRVTTALVIPDLMFVKSPHLVSKCAQDVTSHCEQCGELKPITCANGYMRRQCQCQRREREAAASQQSTAIGTRCYTWLGNPAGDLEKKTFDNFNPWAQVQDALAFKQHLSDAKEYTGKIVLGQAAGNLLLQSSKYGVGKTHLACAILNKLRTERIGGLFCTVPDLFDKLYASDMSEQHDILDQASSTRLLVLDDLDKLYVKRETEGEYQKGKLFTILNRRYLAKLPTVITTNAQDGLDKWLNGATLSRLRERLTTLDMHGIDYRARGQG